MPVEIYASTTSVVAGSSISFYVSALPGATPIVTLKVFRSSQLSFGGSMYATEAATIYESDYRPQISVKAGECPCFQASFPAKSHPIPPNVSTVGCGWPVAATWRVPFDQPSSVYLAQVTRGKDVSYTVFVVRAQTPGKLSKVVCQLSVNTYQAYNPWGGGGFYGPGPIQASFASVVTFARPCQLWDYLLYDEPIVTFLEANGPVEFVTNVDLDADAGLLGSYQLFISCGHDEYYSQNMRDSLDAFATSGGNVLFLSGNTCYRSVTFSGRQQMARTDPNPSNSDLWRNAPFNRPEALTTGQDWSAGLWSTSLPKMGYVVKMPNHWIFDGTGLKAGDSLGSGAGVIGYESDAGVYDAKGNPSSPSPPNLETIASVTLPAWTDYPVQPPNPPPVPFGMAEITAYWRSQGYVMSVGSTGWGQGLRGGGAGDPAVMRVQSNMIARMRYRFGIIYAVDATGKLNWYRDWNQNGTRNVGSGAVIGAAGWNGFQFLTGDETGVIYAVTTGGDLVWYRDYNRDGTGSVVGARTIQVGGWNGFKFVFSGGGGIIYAVSTDGNLHWYRDYNRDGTGTVKESSVIGRGGWNGFKFVFSGGGGIIYAVSPDGNLHFFRDQNRDGAGDVGTGSVIGMGGWNGFVRVLGDSTGNIYAVTAGGDLLAYKDYNRNGKGSVANGQPIGTGGWNLVPNVFSGS
jgi:hypothetical protein